jgi:tetratricopeptide (TPR) repeat protein
MASWPRLISMIFFAPMRGMREARDRGSLAPMMLAAFIVQFIYILATQWLAGNHTLAQNPVGVVFGALFQAAVSLLQVSIVFVPLIALVTNIFERRGSFSVVIQQEYAALAAVMLYVVMAADVYAILVAAFFHFTGIQAGYVASSIQSAPQITAMIKMPAEMQAQFQAQLTDPHIVAANMFRTVKLTLFAIGAVAGVRVAFRVGLLRSITIIVASFVGALLTSPLWALLFNRILVSPFLLLMLFFLLRGYFGELTRTHKARASFKQNLEAATLNPADASAHYNLGLIHQNRGELAQARERFERAVHIDADEVDAHYQLGRIARAEGRWGNAISAFEQVVSRDQMHAQHEVWREIGATYIAAGQFEDARDALERFLDNRQMDPEGLYLMGRAHAGLGHRREATSSMQACIEAVKTAPAYKYRTEKRWLNEAQQFLKLHRQEAVGSKQ